MICQVAAYKRKFQTFSSLSGRRHLQEVVALQEVLN